ncbi:EamA family transporter [Demequina activiva]|uniref:ABC transporter permease n=1 Tax=Demequina activiva TaxID=1582364 RepID=A0A919Q1P9_9MICO|nr:EamA family transporter [Demequina activiva]GIG54577.1 ABC transporter permease [Demequina activiva]
MNRTPLVLATAVAPLLWGTTYLTTTELLPPDRPLLASVVRALPAGLVLLALTRTLPRGVWWWRSLLLGALNIGAFFALLFASAYRLPGGVSATLGAVHPLIVAALAVLVLHEPGRRRTWIAAGMGLAGVAMLVMTPGASVDAVGVAAGLLAGASTAWGVILTKRWGRPVGLVAFTSWQLIWGGLLLVVPMLALEGLPARLSVHHGIGFAWLMTAGAIVSYLLWFRGVLALPASQVSVLTFLAPLTAALLGWGVLGETLSLVQFAGALVILGSVLVSQLRPRSRRTLDPASPGSRHGRGDLSDHGLRRTATAGSRHRRHRSGRTATTPPASRNARHRRATGAAPRRRG